MKLTRRNHLLACAAALVSTLLNAAPLFADPAGMSAAIGTGTPVFDPTQIALQAGGFGLAVYMVIWLTRSLSETLEAVGVALAENTKVLVELKGTVEGLKR